MIRCNPTWFLCLLLAGSLLPLRPAGGQSSAESAQGPAENVQERGRRLARTALMWTDLILEHEIDPPTRQQMLHAATRQLSSSTGLARRLSAVTDRAELEALICETWDTACATDIDSPANLERAFLGGLVQTIGGPTNFLRGKQHQVEEQLRANLYVGIGIRASQDSDGSLIHAVIAGGPAHEAGARDGDRILEVNGASTRGERLAEVVEMLRGAEGTSLTVLIQREGETRLLKLTRSVVRLTSILGPRQDPDASGYDVDPLKRIAYLQVAALRSSTLQELRQVERRLIADGFRALVLDLRHCQRGSLHDAAILADGLSPAGPLGTAESVQRSREFHSGADCLFRDWPLAVLIDDTTAGEIEWLAAALQDTRRAVLIGGPTAGAGYSIASVPLPDGSGVLVLRTAILKRVDGRPLVNRSVALRPPPESIVRPVSRKRAVDAPGADPSQVETRDANEAAPARDGRVHPDHLLKGVREFKQPHPVNPEDRYLIKAIEVLNAALTAQSGRPDTE